MASDLDSTRCRGCGAVLSLSLADLGRTPVANALRRPEQRDRPELYYPLQAMVCETCWLVQLRATLDPGALFTDDYPYFSSYSTLWLRHAELYARQMMAQLPLDEHSLVLEIASNDGYLLQFFQGAGVPVLGIEPAAAVAEAARLQHGITTVQAFFSRRLAQQLRDDGLSPNLLVANNVLAHIPEINDFVAGIALLLNPAGMVTFEFPHLLNLMRLTQFDTIYHEHYSYLSLLAVERILARHGLAVVDAEALTTHGGSLRLYVRHEGQGSAPTARLAALRDQERVAGLDQADTYRDFERRMQIIKRALLRFLLEAKEQGQRVVGYGAPAKGNTLLNYCGIGADFIDFTVDRNPHKQGLFLPGSGIPVYAPERILEVRPDYVLILPWNLKEEVMAQMADVRAWGGRFVIPIPRLEVL